MTLRQINFAIGVLVGLALGWLLRTSTPPEQNLQVMRRPMATRRAG